MNMDTKKIKEYFLNDKYAELVGIKIVDVKGGYCKAEMEVLPKHLNAAGTIQGGALFTLADLAVAVAANTRGQLALSIQADISFIKGISKGMVYAVATEVSEAKKIGNYEVKIKDESGDTIASFHSLVYRKKDKLPF